jgi:hypothetical protein
MLIFLFVFDQSGCSVVQGNKQTTRAAIEFYGPDRAKWLGPLSEGATPDYLQGEFAGEELRSVAWKSTRKANDLIGSGSGS